MFLKFNGFLIIGMLLLGISLFFMFLFIWMVLNKIVLFFDFEVFNVYSCKVGMYVYLDWMSCSFLMFVLLISSMIFFYSIGYMGGDQNIFMFMLLVLSFVISMILLIISPNLISILLGWDGLGLISYCLVIYYQSISSYNSGMLTVMINRIGDMMLLVAISWMMIFGSWNFIYYYDFNKNIFFMLSLLVMLAGMTKSAQIPFSSWLPAAMAAPTPVSSLVHSSTLVTAGVYLMIRFNFILEYFTLKMILMMVSSLTMFMAGFGASFEFDLKKIIALSTLSQLGLMLGCLSMGFIEFAFFHLLTHALFKSMLFMCAGFMIHNMGDIQDIRFMGGVIIQNPLLSFNFLLSNVALCGMPFLAGFYSKDLILEMLLMSSMNFFIFLIFFVSTMFTVMYTFRLIYFSVFDGCKFNSYFMHHNDMKMLNCMSFMSLMVVIMGGLMLWYFFVDLSLVLLPFYLKTFTILVCLMGGFSGYILCKESLTMSSNNFLLNNFMGEMWFLIYINTFIINWVPLWVGEKFYKIVDLKWGEYLGGKGLYNTISMMSGMNQKFYGTFNFFFVMYLYLMMLFMVIFYFL